MNEMRGTSCRALARQLFSGAQWTQTDYSVDRQWLSVVKWQVVPELDYISVRTEGKALIAAQVDDVEWQPDCELVQLGDNQTSLRPRRLPTLLAGRFRSALPDLAWSLTPPSLQPAPDLHTSRLASSHHLLLATPLNKPTSLVSVSQKTTFDTLSDITILVI